MVERALVPGPPHPLWEKTDQPTGTWVTAVTKPPRSIFQHPLKGSLLIQRRKACANPPHPTPYSGVRDYNKGQLLMAPPRGSWSRGPYTHGPLTENGSLLFPSAGSSLSIFGVCVPPNNAFYLATTFLRRDHSVVPAPGRRSRGSFFSQF